ncbi:MAG TPA: hypothetical protein VGF35_03705, partial [Steroidobacteraceae bacterium]
MLDGWQRVRFRALGAERDRGPAWGIVMATCVVQEVKLIHTFAELRERAREVGPKRVGVVLAEDDVALMAASDALQARIAVPVLIGDEERIRERARALGLVELALRAEFVRA